MKLEIDLSLGIAEVQNGINLLNAIMRSAGTGATAEVDAEPAGEATPSAEADQTAEDEAAVAKKVAAKKKRDAKAKAEAAEAAAAAEADEGEDDEATGGDDTPADTGPTIEAVRKALKELAALEGKTAAIDILKKHGSPSITELAKDKYQAVIDDASA